MDEQPVQSAFVNRTAVVLIVATCLSIVLIPAVVAYVPVERSKWRLAEAKNILDLTKDKDEKAIARVESLLDEAKKLNPAIIETFDYMAVSSSIGRNNIDDFAKLLGKLDHKERNVVLLKLSEKFFEDNNPLAVVEVVDKTISNQDFRMPELNNSYAYAAAIAGVRLDQAEAAIDNALQFSQAHAFLDTKAWVLHKQGRNEEALAVMQTAIQKSFQELQPVENPLVVLSAQNQRVKKFVTDIRDSDPLRDVLPENLLSELQMLSSEEVSDDTKERVERTKKSLQEPKPAKFEGDLTKEEVDDILKFFMVYRYHRSEIIRALGFNDIADLEWNAINVMGFTDPSVLQ